MSPTLALAVAAQDSHGSPCGLPSCDNNWTVWTISDEFDGRVHTHRRCSRHAAIYPMTPAEGAAFITSIIGLPVADDLGHDLVEVTVETLVNIGRQDLALHLEDLWDGTRYTGCTKQVDRARFLIGSAAFALLPSVPVPGDDDHSEGDTFSVAGRG